MIGDFFFYTKTHFMGASIIKRREWIVSTNQKQNIIKTHKALSRREKPKKKKCDCFIFLKNPTQIILKKSK